MKTREEIELLFRCFDGQRKAGNQSERDYYAGMGGLGVMSWILESPNANDAANVNFDKLVALQREEEQEFKDREKGFPE